MVQVVSAGFPFAGSGSKVGPGATVPASCSERAAFASAPATGGLVAFKYQDLALKQFAEGSANFPPEYVVMSL